MNQPIKKLPKSVQTLITASNQINSYTKAIKELIFNALDADATSIAVRIHISQGSIQVVDNGCGIPQADYKLIGQNYMTSKLVDISTLKSAPNKYGFQGQSLANLIQISQKFKVTSRFHKSETTCTKTFENGKAKRTEKCIPRPSKGTTVEIKGFLYNLNIQNKSVNMINELQNIKTYLDHMSLVHPKISISLRDDEKNEIVYKVHKNRDMYQTISSLYEIDKANVQELQVEKNQYKVKAYVGKSDVQYTEQIIFINRKIVPDSSLLHKKLNDQFKKYLRGGEKKIKKNQNNDDEYYIFGNKIPFYILFISCPYIDYEMTNTFLEFKDWVQINTLLDKLIKFYIGDVSLIKATPKKQVPFREKQQSESTRNQIENIMRKILGSHKKPEICQMQNGIKGKLIKRKPRSKTKNSKNDNSKLTKNKQKSPTSLVNIEGSKNMSTNKASNHNLSVSLQSKLTKNSKKKKPVSPSPLTTAFIPKGTPKTPKTMHASSNRIKARKQLIGTKKERGKVRLKKKISLSNKFAMETESVKRRYAIVAQETRRLNKEKINRRFIKDSNRNPDVFINENVQCTRSHFTENNKEIEINKRVKEIIIHEYIPIQIEPKVNDNYVYRKNHDRKSFKSNYDLIQTIIGSQVTVCDLLKDKKNKSDFNQERTKPVKGDLINTDLDNNMLINPDYIIKTPEQNFRPFIRKSDIIPVTSDHIKRTCVGDCILSQFNERIFENSRNKIDSHIDSCNMNSMASPNILRYLSSETETLKRQVRPYLDKPPEDIPFSEVTFQSHKYNNNYSRPINNVDMNNKKSRNFITTQSRENFMIKTNFKRPKYRRNKMNLISKLFRSRYTNNYSIPLKVLNSDDNNTLKGIRESYTIEFTESNEYNYNKPMNHDRRTYGTNYSPNDKTNGSFVNIPHSMSQYVNEHNSDDRPQYKPNTYCLLENDSVNNDLDYEPINQNTYTLTDSRKESDIDVSSNHDNNWDKHETYTIARSRVSLCESTNQEFPALRAIDGQAANCKEFIFISEPLEKNINDLIVMNPIDVCETVLSNPASINSQGLDDSRRLNGVSNVIEDNNSGHNEHNDSMNVGFPNHVLADKNDKNPRKSQETDNEKISHHFTLPDSIMSEFNKSLVMSAIVKDNKPMNGHEVNNDMNKEVMEQNNKMKAFNMRNRLFFVPKGLSPIFEGRQEKHEQYDPSEEYYENEIYNNFVNKVHQDAEIFKPRVEEGNELTTKDISKVNDKLHKDNASLKFNGHSIKTANVLGQVDNKFIAATIKSDLNKADEEEFVVLFDQHAVHERIRLENNLADYLTGNQWKSVAIDEVTFKVSRDYIIYLHNYRDKFTQFGLEWTIVNYNEISVIAIPEAILGKNPRPVDKVIKAVKNLIAEEINVIQMQRGCVSLYPKSIMDLVFSEACRYAIKFGDHLSKSQCVELLNKLSHCKAPFQCAHGRPAMAVIMNIEKHKTDYNVNSSKLKQFKDNCK